MYELKYKGNPIKPIKWESVGPGKKRSITWQYFKRDTLKEALVMLRSELTFSMCRDIYNVSLWKDGVLLAKVIKYKDPRDWEIYRVRFYGPQRLMKEILDCNVRFPD